MDIGWRVCYNEITNSRRRIMKKSKINFLISAILLILFVVLTVGILKFDVQPIGPQGSEIGFASINGAINQWFGQSDSWDTVTDLISAVGFLFLGLIGLIGLLQWVKRKNLWKVDKEILILAAFYVLFAVVYVLFEKMPINYRPILEEGLLEPSYPSTHTMMVIWMLGSSAMVFNGLIRNRGIKLAVGFISIVLMLLTAVGRLAAGVHWFTDVFGGILLASTLLMFYYSVIYKMNQK